MVDKSFDTIREMNQYETVKLSILFQEHTKLMVRGYKWAEYHADIYDPEDEKLRKVGLDAQCLGGGRIEHQPAKNYLKVQARSE